MKKSTEEIKKLIDFDAYLKQELKNPLSKKYYDQFGRELEIAYGMLQARKAAGISQATLAKKIGTTQSNIARMESGQQNFTIRTLQKIAIVCGKDLRVEFVSVK